MKFRSLIDFSDLLLSIASSGLAFACAFFAGFMMLKMEGGRGGPEALPVTVDGAQLRAIAAAPAGVDPLTTGSVTPIVGRQKNAGAVGFSIRHLSGAHLLQALAGDRRHGLYRDRRHFGPPHLAGGEG